MSQLEPTRPRGGRYLGEPHTIDDRTTMISVVRTGLRGAPVTVGVLTITDGTTTWTPVVDAGRVAVIGVITALIAATLCSAAVLRQPPWPKMTIEADRFPGGNR